MEKQDRHSRSEARKQKIASRLTRVLPSKILEIVNSPIADTADSSIATLNVFSLVAAAIALLFGYINMIARDDQVMGTIEIAISLLIMINLMVAQLARNLKSATHILVGSMFLLFIALGISEGAHWLLVFPPVAIFLLGKRRGFIWVTILLAVLLCWLLAIRIWPLEASAINLVRDTTFSPGILFSLVTLAATLYLFQYHHEQSVSSLAAINRSNTAERMKTALLIRDIDTGILVLDTKGFITTANPFAAKMLGWLPDEMIGQTFSHCIPLLEETGSAVPVKKRSVHRLLGGAKSKQIEMRVLRKDGTTFVARLAINCIIADNKCDSILVTIHDITSEHLSSKTKTEFMTLVSHQLRTPVSAIQWISEMLLKGDFGKLTKAQHEQITSILSNNTRMNNLIGELLLVSNIDLGILPIHTQPVNISKIAAGILNEEMATLSTPKKLTTRENYDPTLPEIPLDLSLTKTMLHQIVRNAVRYTPEGGNVSIETILSPALPGSGQENWISIIISDSGYGIPERDQPSVFNKFFRGSNITTYDTEGTGLGLFVTKTLVDYVGGQISFDSTQNVGTTIVIKLPLRGMVSKNPDKLPSDIVGYMADYDARS